MLVLADTGILLRFVERTDPAHDIVRHAIRILANQGNEIVCMHTNSRSLARGDGVPFV